jgi:hypothetical protein
VLGITRVVLHTELAHVQLDIAGLTDIQAPQRQAKCGERSSTVPAD